MEIQSVLFINQSLGWGGAEVFNSQLLNWICQKGVKVTCYVTHPKFTAHLPNPRRIPIVIDIIGDWKGLVKGLFLLPLGIAYYGWLAWSGRHNDIIFMTGFIEKILVTPWAKLLGIPVVWVEFAPLQTVFAKFWGLPKLLYFLVKNLPDEVIVPTRNTQSQLPLISTVIPCAVEPHKYKVTKIQSNLVVCVSRLEKGKGQDLLIAAWPEVLKNVPDAKLKIIGEGSLDLKPCKNVVVTGWVDDAILEIAKSRVCVFPSVWPLEGFGIVMIEAMSQNKPVVAFDIGPAREIIDDTCGILVKPGDPQQLAKAIVKMLKKPINTGRIRYERLFSWPVVGPQYLQVFKYVVAKNSVK